MLGICSSGKMCTDRCVENKLPGGFIPWLMITSVGLSILHPDINTLRFLVGGGQPGQLQPIMGVSTINNIAIGHTCHLF